MRLEKQRLLKIENKLKKKIDAFPSLLQVIVFAVNFFVDKLQHPHFLRNSLNFKSTYTETLCLTAFGFCVFFVECEFLQSSTCRIAEKLRKDNCEVMHIDGLI